VEKRALVFATNLFIGKHLLPARRCAGIFGSDLKLLAHGSRAIAQFQQIVATT
jgi:hypothetical protein